MFIELSKVNILSYLNQLNKKQKPDWGNMSSQRMIEHLSDIVLISRSLNHEFSLKIKHDTIRTFSSYEIYVRNDKLIIDHYDTHDELVSLSIVKSMFPLSLCS